MKKHTNRFRVLFTAVLLLATVVSAMAGDPDGEKKKTVTKSYPLSAGEKVSINNSFGQVKIVTWDKSEVKAEITITVSSKSDETTQEILDGITIEDGKNSNGVFFKTHMANQGGTHHKDKSGNQKFQINYEVSLPAATPLKLENSFGNSEVPDMTGPVDITQKFGDLVAGNLHNLQELHVEFGSAKVEAITGGKTVVKFSKAEIRNMSGAIKASFEFSEVVKLGLDNSVTELTLTNSYSTIEMKVAENFGGDFSIHTNFGEFTNHSKLVIKEQKEDNSDEDHGPKFDKDFNGVTGNGACKVKIKSSFGNIKFI